MPTLTLTQWSTLVERWNVALRDERSAAATACHARGHRWAIVAGLGACVCRRCCEYRPVAGTPR